MNICNGKSGDQNNFNDGNWYTAKCKWVCTLEQFYYFILEVFLRKPAFMNRKKRLNNLIRPTISFYSVIILSMITAVPLQIVISIIRLSFKFCFWMACMIELLDSRSFVTYIINLETNDIKKFSRHELKATLIRSAISFCPGICIFHLTRDAGRIRWIQNSFWREKSAGY